MSKFVRIDKAQDPKKAVMLNLDLVATAELSHDKSFRSGEPDRAHLSLYSAERYTLASMYFDSVEEGNRWVKEHIGVEL